MEALTPLQERRRSLDLSLRQLAEYSGINRGLLSLWERGRYIPTAEEQARINGVIQDFELARGHRGVPAFLTPEERQARATARRTLQRALAKGTIVRGPCERCGAEPGQAHHRWGYDEPLRVVWLCGSCHGMEHAAMNEDRQQQAIVDRRDRAAHLKRRAVTAYRGESRAESPEAPA